MHRRGGQRQVSASLVRPERVQSELPRPAHRRTPHFVDGAIERHDSLPDGHLRERMHKKRRSTARPVPECDQRMLPARQGPTPVAGVLHGRQHERLHIERRGYRRRHIRPKLPLEIHGDFEEPDLDGRFALDLPGRGP